MPRTLSQTALLLTFSFCLLMVSTASAQNQVTYIYDQAGRLVGVVDQTGAAAAYKYDAAGNILSITRYTASQVAIIAFSPSTGPVGSTVTINGTGFSATPSQNTVKFNGTLATVVSSTTTQIVTTVPSGATNGTISVTSPLGSTTSSNSFTVGTAASAPFITSFTPTVDTSGGGTLTISGGNFSTVAGNNKVKINLGYAAVTSATASSLSVTVPQAATAGRLTVTTPTGSTVSSGDFFVAPAGQVLASNADARMSIGSTGTVTVAGNGWAGLLIFDGTAGQRISMSLSSNGACYGSNGIQVGLIDPFQTLLSGSVGGIGCYNNGTFFDPVTLPVTGTYSYVLQSEFATVTAGITTYNVVDINGSITINGPQVPITLTTPGQNANLTFAGSQGQQITVNASNNTISNVQWDLIDPTGAEILFAGFGSSTTLQMNGTYTLVVDPQGSATGSLNVAMTSP